MVVVAALVGAIVLLTSESPSVPAVVLPAPVIPSPANSPATAIPAPVIVPTILEAAPDAYEPVSVSLKPSANGNELEAPVPQEEAANLTHVARIRITSADPGQNAEVVVKRLRKVDAPTPPQSVLVLRNIDITLSGIENSDQASGEIEFEVKSKWLQDQNLNAADVSLYRLHGEWSELPTKHMGQSVGAEDELYESYVAETPGFSVFAVGIRFEPPAAQPPMAAPAPTSTQTPVSRPTATVIPATAAIVPPAVTRTPTAMSAPTPTTTAAPAPTNIPTSTPMPTGTPTPTPTRRPTYTPTPRIPPTPTLPPTPSATSWFNKGEVYRKSEKWETAIWRYTEAIRSNPSYRDAYFYRGYSYAELGQHQNAVQDYSKAIDLRPSAPPTTTGVSLTET